MSQLACPEDVLLRTRADLIAYNVAGGANEIIELAHLSVRTSVYVSVGFNFRTKTNTEGTYHECHGQQNLAKCVHVIAPLWLGLALRPTRLSCSVALQRPQCESFPTTYDHYGTSLHCYRP